jgi:phosphonate transport system ATP-binding protein
MLDIAPDRPNTASDVLPDAVLTTRGLRKSYDRRTEILKGVDLTIRRGERVALIGSNGCGKSTLLRCLIGLHEVSAGEVTALGETFRVLPAGAQKARLRRQTGFVFQKHCLVRRRSVLSNVVHGMLSETGSWRAFSQSLAPEPWRRSALEALSWGKSGRQGVVACRCVVRRPAAAGGDRPRACASPGASDRR